MAPRKKTTKKTTKTATPAPGGNGAIAPVSIGMTDDEVNQYLASIAKGEVALAGMEADVAEKFRAVTHQSQQTAQAVQQLSAQLEQGRAQAQQLAGELKGYATLLITAEDGRRKTKGSTKPKLEAVKNQENAEQ